MAPRPKGGLPSNTFLRLQRNLHLLFLLYWMKPLITPGTAWLARAMDFWICLWQTRPVKKNIAAGKGSTRGRRASDDRTGLYCSTLIQYSKARHPLDNTAQLQLEQNAVQAPDQRSAAAPWSLAHRIAFRFACCYLVLYMAPDEGKVSLIDMIPGSWPADTYGAVWHKLVPWVAIHILHLSGKATTYFPTGSGDTTLCYIENLLFVVFAAVGAVIWSLADHQRKDYRQVHSWLRVAVRYTLAFTMLDYGFMKVFPLQFGGLGVTALIEPYGYFSPMGVLWKFMGASMAYTIFAGICEVVGGTLLLFRRTTMLGALVSFGVLLNVALLNFCYDVPVKLYSTNLLLIAIFIAAPDLPRLLNFLVLNRVGEPADLAAPRFRRRWMRISAAVFQALFVGYFLCSTLNNDWVAYKERNGNEKRPPLYGLYDVESFTRNGQELPPLITDPARWKKVFIQHARFLGIQMMDDSPKYYNSEYDAAKHTIALSQAADKSHTNVLSYAWLDADHVVLQGDLGTNTLSVHMRKIDMSKFLLVNRGFHWINELPFNR